MLGIGIHNKVRITKTTKNDKGVLVINFKSSEEVNPLTALETAGQAEFTTPEQTIMVFGPKTEGYGGTTLTTQQLVDKIAELRNPLDHIASVYLTADKRKWDPFIGTGITNDNLSAKLSQQDTLDKIYDNLVNQFITMMTPVVGETSKLTNVMFIRQSKTKHYPRLRTKYLTTYPFIEDATATPSKLKFSKYETENGLDKGEEAGGAVTPTIEEVEQANSVFNS